MQDLFLRLHFVAHKDIVKVTKKSAPYLLTKLNAMSAFEINQIRSPLLKEHTTTPYSCHGVFTDRSIFSLTLKQIETPTGTPVTNHKHGLVFSSYVFSILSC